MVEACVWLPFSTGYFSVPAVTRAINPESLAAPSGYANGVLCEPGRVLFVAGQIGWDVERKLVSPDFVPQFAQAMRNVMAVVTDAGGTAEHVGRLVMYVTDKKVYATQTRAIGEAYRAVMGRHYPAMSLVQVAALLEEGALVEIEATAVIP